MKKKGDGKKRYDFSYRELEEKVPWPAQESIACYIAWYALLTRKP